jgi:hypothetical protein
VSFLSGNDPDEDCHAIPVLGIGHYSFKARCRWNCFPVLDDTLDVQGESLFRHGLGIIQSPSGGYDARKIGE